MRFGDKVLLVTDHLRRDGAQRQFAALARGLHTLGVPCSVCVLESGGALAVPLRESGIRVLEAGKRSRSDLFRMIGFLRETIRSERPGVLQSFLFHSNNLCRVAGRRERVPVIVTSQRCTPYRRFIPLAALAVEQAVLGFSHATVINFPPPRRGRARSPFVFIPNGVDTERFRPMSGGPGEAGPAPDPDPFGIGERSQGGGSAVPGILAAGRLEPQKGHLVLLEAMVLLKKENVSARLFIAGEGALRAPMERFVERHGLGDRVCLAGLRDDMERLYPRVDVVVHPSGFEGMPNTVMEAMACARPVVATDVGGTSLLFRDGVEGILVPPGDAGAIARGIRRLLEDPRLAADMGRAARKRMKEEFTLERMVQGYVALYEDLRARRRKRTCPENRF